MSALSRVIRNLSWVNNPLVIVLPKQMHRELVAEWRAQDIDGLIPTHINGVPFVVGEMRDAFVLCNGFDFPTIHMLA